MPSLVKTARRCVLMVLTETPSSVAADLLAWPEPMRVATRRSAWVSDGQPVAGLPAVTDHLARRAPASRMARWVSARKATAPIWWYASHARSSWASPACRSPAASSAPPQGSAPQAPRARAAGRGDPAAHDREPGLADRIVSAAEVFSVTQLGGCGVDVTA